jgi:MFS family permease
LIARRTGDLNALMLASGLQVFGILLPLLGATLHAGANLSLAFAVLGSLLFGSCMVGIVSLVLSMAGRYYPSRPAKMMGRMTLSYGVAQMIAPAFTGWLATGSGSYASGLYFAAAAMVLCLLLLAVLRAMEVRGGAAVASSAC